MDHTRQTCIHIQTQLSHLLGVVHWMQERMAISLLGQFAHKLHLNRQNTVFGVQHKQRRFQLQVCHCNVNNNKISLCYH